MPRFGCPGKPMLNSVAANLRASQPLDRQPIQPTKLKHCHLRLQPSPKTMHTGQIYALGVKELEGYFIDSLVAAGTCPCHGDGRTAGSAWQKRSTLHVTPIPWRIQVTSSQFRNIHTRSRSLNEALPRPCELSKVDCLGLVDFYRDWDLEDQSTSSGSNIRALPKPDNGPTKAVSAEAHEEASPEVDRAVERAVRMIEDYEASLKDVFEAIQTLPSPRVHLLREPVRLKLLQRFSVMEKKSEANALRYLSLVDDMKAANLPLNKKQWNSAIHLVGRCYSKITASEVESALLVWKEMEQEAGLKGRVTTFNTLLDIAVKAGQFSLAELILKEMGERELRFDRFTRVGLIFYQGVKGDGNGVRKAYRDYVEAGEIVDTAVLNCVMASLLRAGEYPAAEQVYMRMKTMYESQTGKELPLPNWREAKELGAMLKKLTARYRAYPQMVQKLQDEQYLFPNTKTFIIFVEHHVSHTGELIRVANMLDEMQSLGLPAHGRLFMELFRGFAFHGGVRYTSWTRRRLESVWEAFWESYDAKLENIYVAKWMVIWMVRAFAKCCGPEKTLEIWEELKSKWKAEDGEMEVVRAVLHTSLHFSERAFGRSVNHGL